MMITTTRATGRFFSLLALLVLTTLLSSAFAQSGKTCREEKVGKTYYTVCPDNIVTEKKKVMLSTKSVAKKIDGKNTVNIVHFYMADRKAKGTDEMFLLYGKFINSLEDHTLFINGKEFTGVLKVGVPFMNEGAASYSGYDLLIYEFKEGKFEGKRKLTDVDLEKEKAIVRPA
jgi:hypothetical protein